MLKTYQFKTQCKADVHISKTVNIILPGLTTKYMWTPVRVQNRIQVKMHPWMLVETTHVTEIEYYFFYLFTYLSLFKQKHRPNKPRL